MVRSSLHTNTRNYYWGEEDMRFDLEAIYTVYLADGYRFAARCIEVDGKYVTFESRNSIQSKHHINEIKSVRKQ